MKPGKTYQKTGCTIRMFNADCMEYLEACSENQYELAIVDPPYGIGQPKQSNLKGYNNRKSLSERIEKNRLNNGYSKSKNRVLNTSNTGWDDKPPDDLFFDLLNKSACNRIIWGGNYFNLLPTRCVICWDKMQPWENFSQIELAWTSFDRPAQIYKIDNRKGGKIHPTQKPVALYKWLLHKFAKPGDTILDTHGGSMSIAIACWDMGFDLDIIELDKEYFYAAVKRFEQHISQLQIDF